MITDKQEFESYRGLTTFFTLALTIIVIGLPQMSTGWQSFFSAIGLFCIWQIVAHAMNTGWYEAKMKFDKDSE